jgi:integrase
LWRWRNADEVKTQRLAAKVTSDVRREFCSIWGKLPVTELTTLDIRDVIKAKAATAPAQARNLLGHLQRLFGGGAARLWATGQPGCAAAPDEAVGRKVMRQRVLTDELRALWAASAKLDYPYGPLLKVLMLTGQRRSEVAEARWPEFDLTKRLWTIPPDRMKGAAARVVPLTDPVLAILGGLPRFTKGDHVFSTSFGASPVTGFSRLKDRLDKLLGGATDYVLHDVRRTMRTHLSALPITDRVRELVIAHAQPGLHKVYDQHAYLDEKRHALELWAARLHGIVAPAQGANVVALRP